MTGAPTYVERLAPPPAYHAGVWVFAAVLGVTLGAVLHPVTGLLVTVSTGVLASVALMRSATQVRVADGVLAAGRARIPVSLLGPARVLDTEESREVRGPRSDPAGFHLIRAWVPAGVLLDVRDPADPAPYWFVASRHPDALAAAIESARDEPV